jgi:hypothetical protein
VLPRVFEYDVAQCVSPFTLDGGGTMRGLEKPSAHPSSQTLAEIAAYSENSVAVQAQRNVCQYYYFVIRESFSNQFREDC